MSKIHDVILELCAKDIGIQEVQGNRGWKGEEGKRLYNEMIEVGWKEPDPYCSTWCKKIWTKAYESLGEMELAKIVRKVISANAQRSLKNIEGTKFTFGYEPILGAIGVMQLGTTTKGHAFILKGYKNAMLTTYEANTNRTGSREGDGIYIKQRWNMIRPTQGLHLLGFIYPVEV